MKMVLNITISNSVKIRPTEITSSIRHRSPPRSVTTEKPVNTQNHERNYIYRNSDDINIQPLEVRPKRAIKPPKFLDDCQILTVNNVFILV